MVEKKFLKLVILLGLTELANIHRKAKHLSRQS